MEQKLHGLLSRFEEVEAALGAPDVHSDQKRFRELSQEHSYLSELKDVYEQFQTSKKDLENNRNLLKEEKDPEFTEVILDLEILFQCLNVFVLLTNEVSDFLLGFFEFLLQ